jgi:hypothetical protein
MTPSVVLTFQNRWFFILFHQVYPMLHDQYIMHVFPSQEEGILFLKKAGFQVNKQVDVLGCEVLPGEIPNNYKIIPGSDPKQKRHKAAAYVESNCRLVRCNWDDPVILDFQDREIMGALYKAGVAPMRIIF